MRQALKRLAGAVLRKSSSPVIAVFVAGNDPASRRMVKQVRELVPDHPHILVGWGKLDPSQFPGVDEVIELDPNRPLQSLFGLRRRLARYWVALMPSMWSEDLPAGRRLTPLFTAPRKWLAFHPDGERHHVRPSHPIASWRFLKGDRVGDIYRPTQFTFVKEWFAWLPVPLLMAGWGVARLRALQTPAAPSEPSTEGFTVMCLPGEDFPQRLDDEVRHSGVAEVVFTPQPTLPEAATTAGLRACLAEPGVWMVCARASSMDFLAEEAGTPADDESGTFCLGASSSIFLFRRDDYLRLGGLAHLESQIPGRGLSALSLLGWLRGRKTVYAGHVAFSDDGSSGGTAADQVSRSMGPLVVAAVDHAPTAARLLHRHGRNKAFWVPFWRAAARLKPPRPGTRRTSALIPLVRPGARVFPGRETGHGMRLAVVSPYFPYPLSHGGAIRIFNLLQRAAQYCDVFLFCYSENELAEEVKVMLDFCARIVLVKPPVWEKPPLMRRWPTGVARYRLDQMRAYLTEFVSDFRIGIVQAEFTQLAFVGAWLSGSGAKTILVEHDVTFHLHQQAAGQASSANRAAAQAEAVRWKRYELSQARSFDRIVTMSTVDRQRLLEQQVPESKVRVIENGIDLERFQSRESDRDNSQLLFIGSFRHFPNLRGFQMLVERIWPLILRERPEARLTVVAGPDPETYWKQHTGEDAPALPSSVEMHGFVSDVRPLYERSTVVVAPLPLSAGTNIKVLEALAMKRPIVSTAVGCAGLGLEPGEHVLVADEPQGFAHAVLRLLENPGLRRRLSENGRRLVTERFDWDHLAEKQLDLYEELTRGS